MPLLSEIKKRRNQKDKYDRYVSEFLKFALEFAALDLSQCDSRLHSFLCMRLERFLDHGAMFATLSAKWNISVYAHKPSIEIDSNYKDVPVAYHYSIQDFIRLQNKTRPVLKALVESENLIDFTDVLSSGFSIKYFGTESGKIRISLRTENTDDAFLFSLIFVVLKEGLENIRACAICSTPFYRIKRQTFCNTCKKVAAAQRVKEWRSVKRNKIKEAAQKRKSRLQQKAMKLKRNGIDTAEISKILSSDAGTIIDAEQVHELIKESASVHPSKTKRRK